MINKEKELVDLFLKNRSKELYDEIILKHIKEHKRCTQCNGPIYYDSSVFSYTKLNGLCVDRKSYKSKKELLGNIYYLSVCEDCLSDKFPEYKNINKSRVFNRICNITNYAFNIPIDISEQWKKQNYSITEETLISKYGENIGKKKWKIYCKKQSLSNKFEYKRDKYGWDKEKFDEYNKNRSITLENLIYRHGEDDGIKIWDEYISKQKTTKSKEYVINMYGEEYWNELCLKKSHSLKNNIERLGLNDGINTYINKFNNINVYPPSKSSQKFFDNIDIILKNKYTTYFFNKNEEFCVFDNELGFIFLDYYIKELNIVIEFNGDMWHANPNKYKDDDIIPILNKTAKEIREKDNIRYNKLKEKYNFNIIVIWENSLPNISDLLIDIEKIKNKKENE